MSALTLREYGRLRALAVACVEDPATAARSLRVALSQRSLVHLSQTYQEAARCVVDMVRPQVPSDRPAWLHDGLASPEARILAASTLTWARAEIEARRKFMAYQGGRIVEEA